MEVLEKVGEKFGHEFVFNEYDAGGCSIDKHGVPLTQETIDGCLASDSVMLGAVGGPKWDDVPIHLRPEKALLTQKRARPIYKSQTGKDTACSEGCLRTQT